MARSNPALDISNEVVQLYRARFGRGPMKARTYVEDDLVVCVLREVMSTEDRSAVEAGRPDLVAELRRTVRSAARDELRAIVERHVHKPVVAVMSDMDVDANITVLSFVLDAPS